ncbi:hypothetical protein PV327_005620 [Microctonus hyperodae]|uniref:Uncharacterized protein n=1 Tax=Microctonus hyperodae TaxID=165561 RepID=A0AA39L007_MICHY|nr:hypothetical protein PV327_005620 [Microctonus hyperodae]
MSVAHVNGQVSGIVGRTLTTTTNPSAISYGTSDTLNHQINSQTTSNPFNHFSTNVDLEYELFPNSSWDLDSNSGCGGDTPESRNNPTSNSRPPSQPAPNAAASSPQAPYTTNSTVTSHCSPLRAYSPSSMIGAHSFSNSFPFSPLQDSQQSLISGAGTINSGSSSSGAGTSVGSIGKDARGCPTPNHSGIENIGTIGASSSSSSSSSTTTSISTATTTTSVSTSSSTSSAVAAATSTISTSGTSTSSLSGTITATAAATTTTSSSSITPASLSVAPTTNLLTTAESQSNNLNTAGDSGRLRNLLTKGVNVNSGDDTQDSASVSGGGGGGSSSNNDTENQNDHRILKILLNQQDEDDYHSEHSGKVRPNPNAIPKPPSDQNKSSLGNNMLLQLLNEKNDDDDDTRAGLKKQNELLQQLLKDPDEERKMQEQKSRDDDSLLRSLGFRSSTPPSSQSSDHVHGGSSQSGQKRPGEDGDINMAVKRPMDGTHQVSSSGSSTTSQTPSKLWERNKMLASLLAKEPSQPTIIPPIPASVISATPQMTSGTPVTTTHNYQPPPMYQQQTRVRFTGQAGIRQTAAPFTQQQQQQQLQLQLQRNKLLQQQQLKQRLLQQQQQQQLLIPSNATAPDQISGIHNIDNLMNNTVAPNVSLQRSSVSDSQISPGYGGSVQLSTNHRLSHSYSHPSTINQHPAVNNNFNSGQQVSATARLSPHSPAGMLSFSHPQPLSPRVSQGNYVNNPRMFNVNQTRAQQQQQQQPATQQQLQQQRSMPSPGSAVSARQSPYPAEVFPPPASPTASQFPPVPNPGNANPTAQYRLQRASSTPTATTQLPGGIGSPRLYGGVSKDQQQTLLSPSHPRGGCQTTPTHNQHNVTNQNQHFTNQQHTSMLYRQTGNNVSNHDVQKNQFCYEQGSVSVYSSGPEDPRSMSSSNPVNHQMGGNTSGPGNMTSEFVRQELRAVVGARTQQRVPNNIQNNLIGQVSQDELEALGLSFEMSPAEYYGGSGAR